MTGVSQLMSSLTGAVSLGRLADRVAKAVGWTPVGRSVVLQGAEGPDSRYFSGLSGTVVSVGDGVMYVEAIRTDRESGNIPIRLRLTPRHKGWTPFSLMLVRIAVVAEFVNDGNGPARVAIAVIGLDRRGGHQTRML